MGSGSLPRPPLTPERVANLAETMGIAVTPDLLPDATAALGELLTLDVAFADLALSEIDPGIDDVSWSEVQS